MTRWGYDDVNGIIIGGSEVYGQLEYDGRIQGDKFCADTEDGLREMAIEKVAQLKAEYSGHPCFLYRRKTYHPVYGRHTPIGRTPHHRR
jgi:hypothetical protein